MAVVPQRIYVLHGLLETAAGQFAPQLSAWKETLTPIPVDLPGHGRCTIDARIPYIPAAVRYALAVIERFGAGHVVAASHLGGPVAVRCALARPDLVRSLVLTGFVPNIPREVFAGWMEGFVAVASENPNLAKWYEDRHGSRWPATLDAYTKDVRERYETTVGIDGVALGALEPPTLILNGSLKSNERAAAEQASSFGPSLRGHVIHDAGHLPARDQPEQFLAITEGFWNNPKPSVDAPSP